MLMPNLYAFKRPLLPAVLKRIVLLLLICAPFSGFAQYWQGGIFGGASNYSGDLAEQRVDMRYTRGVVGLFVKRDVNRYLTVRFGLNYGRIAGADSTNKDTFLIARNLSFRSPIFEANLIGEFNFFDIDEKGFTPYLFAGVSLFSFYPTTKDANGNTVKLRALSTEGQGLPQYPDRKQYNLREISIPFGAGVKVLINESWMVGAEIGFRKTFSDYLDDVSKTYVDKNTLLAERGQRSVDYAYRGNQVSGHVAPGTYPVDGTKRGSDKYTDWYIFSGLTLSYRFGGDKGPYNRWGKQKVSDCPRF